MNADQLQRLPGAEIVLTGIADQEKGRRSIEASAVGCAATRLAWLGAKAPADTGVPASHRLYAELSATYGDGAHSRQRAILARVLSFARAAERARGS